MSLAQNQWKICLQLFFGIIQQFIDRGLKTNWPTCFCVSQCDANEIGWKYTNHKELPYIVGGVLSFNFAYLVFLNLATTVLKDDYSTGLNIKH